MSVTIDYEYSVAARNPRLSEINCADRRLGPAGPKIAKREDAHSASCEGHARFTDGMALHAFCVQDEIMVLQHHPEVSAPCAFGLKYAAQIDFQGCRRAADIGTGTGLLAILAAKKGVPEIKATDVSEDAVQLAEQNIREMNAVGGVETRHGHFFCDLTGVFDVITANLPQKIIPPGYRATLTRQQSQAIDGGGPGGNAVLLNFLDVAPAYMQAETRLYITVNTITDYKRTLQRMNERFQATLVWEGKTSTPTFVRENIGFFRELIDAGVVALVEGECGDWQARQFIYRLALRSGSAGAS